MENSKPSLTDLLISMRERPKPINPPLLYHYTHRTALSGILSSKSIWATDARQLEDPSEIRYGFEIAQEILSDELTSADKSGQKSMHACLEIGLSEMNLVSDCSSDAYVACFCADPHSDFHYRKFGAYRIEFYLSPCQVEFPLTSRANYRHIWLEKVLYEPDLQRQALRKRLQVFRRRAEEFESLGFTFIADSMLETVLNPRVYIVKRPALAAENEWRGVFLPKMDDWWSRYETEQGIHTTLNKRGHEVRYVELVPREGILRVRSICWAQILSATLGQNKSTACYLNAVLPVCQLPFDGLFTSPPLRRLSSKVQFLD